jgi:hypothetical protein
VASLRQLRATHRTAQTITSTARPSSSLPPRERAPRREVERVPDGGEQQLVPPAARPPAVGENAAQPLPALEERPKTSYMTGFASASRTELDIIGSLRR